MEGRKLWTNIAIASRSLAQIVRSLLRTFPDRPDNDGDHRFGFTFPSSA